MGNVAINHDHALMPERRALADLVAMLDNQESELQTLVRLLQDERAHVAAFDIAALLQTVQDKAEALATWDANRTLRRNQCIDIWIRLGMRQRDLPDRLPDMLVALADAGQRNGLDLALRASAFEALFDVTAELQRSNRAAVERTLSWLDDCLGERDTDRRPRTYGANGHNRAATQPLLRRVV